MKAQEPEEKLFILDLLKLNKSIKIDDKVFYPEESVINIIKQVLNKPVEPAKGLTDEEIEEKYPTKIADIEKMLKMEKKSYSKNIYDYILSIAESNKQYQAIAKWARSRMQGDFDRTSKLEKDLKDAEAMFEKMELTAFNFEKRIKKLEELAGLYKQRIDYMHRVSMGEDVVVSYGDNIRQRISELRKELNLK